GPRSASPLSSSRRASGRSKARSPPPSAPSGSPRERGSRSRSCVARRRRCGSAWASSSSPPCVRCRYPYRRRKARLRPPDAGDASGNATPSALAAGDVVLELGDDELLLGDERLHDVADRDHADHLSLLQHRQVAYVLVRHERHAIL